MRYLTLTLTGLLMLCHVPVAKAQVYDDNVVIVLDASGSMKGLLISAGGASQIDRLTAAKTAIKEVVKTIPNSTNIGLLVFGGGRDGWVYPLGPRDDARLMKAVDAIKAGGGTPLGEYMKKGGDRLLETRHSQYGYGTYRLLIVTDGEANNPALVDKYVGDIMSRGIVTDVIGVDMKKAHTLSTRVNSYRSANDQESLKKAIHEVFAEVGKGAGDDSGAESFEALEGFPADLSMALLGAWGSPGNHNIGENPSAGPAVSPPTQDAAVGQPASTVPPGQKKSLVRFALTFMAIAFFMTVIFASWLFKRIK